ncbi:hypothetical protein HAX54_005130, partial [Datura stramonium]|nr:hypothetical protein [Datura stramonium]
MKLLKTTEWPQGMKLPMDLLEQQLHSSLTANECGSTICRSEEEEEGLRNIDQMSLAFMMLNEGILSASIVRRFSG